MLEEQRLYEIRTQEAWQVQQHQRILLIIAVMGSLLLVALTVYIFSHSIGQRFGVLTANVRKLAQRQPLSERLDGQDEISHLDEVLHQTSQQLEAIEKTASAYRTELEKRALELNIVNLHLQQQRQENEIFIYSVSHDLKSPLINLQGFNKELTRACQELKALLKTDNAQNISLQNRQAMQNIIDNDIVKSLHFLQTAVMRTSNIIDALLSLSRAGRVEYHAQSVDITDIVHRVIDAMNSTLRHRKVQVKVHPMPAAWADPTAIEQIFGNLIDNAVAYLDAERLGIIEIGALEPPEPDNPATETDTAAIVHNSFCTYYVKDNGSGIPDICLPNVFTAFRRFHTSIAGEGIGLTLVQRAVERHGGKIWLESKEGSGTTFFISLPLNSQSIPLQLPHI